MENAGSIGHDHAHGVGSNVVDHGGAAFDVGDALGERREQSVADLGAQRRDDLVVVVRANQQHAVVLAAHSLTTDRPCDSGAKALLRHDLLDGAQKRGPTRQSGRDAVERHPAQVILVTLDRSHQQPCERTDRCEGHQAHAPCERGLRLEPVDGVDRNPRAEQQAAGCARNDTTGDTKHSCSEKNRQVEDVRQGVSRAAADHHGRQRRDRQQCEQEADDDLAAPAFRRIEPGEGKDVANRRRLGACRGHRHAASIADRARRPTVLVATASF
jgi:hypothetical protein